MRNVLVLVSIFSVLGCTSPFSRSEFKKGQEEQEKGNFTQAIVHFRRVMQKTPESEYALNSAREAGRISLFEIKNFKDAVGFYSHIVNFGKSDRERREAQRTIANIYFEKLADYPKAIEEFNKLLMLRNSNEDVVNLRFNLARAEFYLNKFSEAQTEIEQALKIVESGDRKFEMLMFLGNIYFNTHKTDQAIELYERIMQEYPERSKKDNVAMNVVVCYEDAELFDKAIEKLELMRPDYPDPEFIDLKIKRMKTRKANLPGSRGLRK